jgi:hypothetical protein
VDGEDKPQFIKTWGDTERMVIPLKVMVWKQHVNAARDDVLPW